MEGCQLLLNEQQVNNAAPHIHHFSAHTNPTLVHRHTGTEQAPILIKAPSKFHHSYTSYLTYIWRKKKINTFFLRFHRIPLDFTASIPSNLKPPIRSRQILAPVSIRAIEFPIFLLFFRTDLAGVIVVTILSFHRRMSTATPTDQTATATPI